MKFTATFITITIALLCMLSQLHAASEKEILLKFQIYSLPLDEGISFLITKNPSGNPSQTLDAINELVRERKAALVDEISLETDAGMRVDTENNGNTISVETVLSKDKSAINIFSSVLALNTKIIGQQSVAFGNALFNGALKSSDGKNLILVYVIPFLK